MAPSIVAMDKESVVEAALLVRRGGLVVYPTDTVYALGCNPEDDRAVGRLFEAKKREARPIPVLCSSPESAQRLVTLSPKALSLAERYWPGPLTIVAPLRRELPFQLHQGSGTLGVRVPASEPCLSLITACGGILTGTSANVSGSPSSRTAGDAELQLGTRVDMILDGGHLLGLESTVVRVVGEKIEAIRRGPVGVTDETD